jgi:hypothetical protein
MGFWSRVGAAIVTGGASEVGGTPGRVVAAVATGGATEITPLVNKGVNAAIEKVADGMDIDLDGGNRWLNFLDPRRPGNFVVETAQGHRDLIHGLISDVANNGMEINHGIVEWFTSGDTDRLANGLFRRPLETAVGHELLNIRVIASGVQTVAGLERPSRGLTGDEIAELKKIFGENIDYSQVRIKDGPEAGIASLNDGNRAFTSGNTIYMKRDKSAPDYLETLVHEMTHVWQFQNGGTAYQAQSLTAQGESPNNGAYDWQAAMQAGKSWSELNPEEQAKLIEDGYAAGVLGDPPRATPLPGHGPFTGSEMGYMQRCWEELKANAGAP